MHRQFKRDIVEKWFYDTTETGTTTTGGAQTGVCKHHEQAESVNASLDSTVTSNLVSLFSFEESVTLNVTQTQAVSFLPHIHSP